MQRFRSDIFLCLLSEYPGSKTKASLKRRGGLARYTGLGGYICLFCFFLLFVTGCRSTPSPAPDLPAVPLENALSALTIPTYEGSGQVTEPNLVFFDLPWHGFRYWMAFSPYPNGDASKENPSIVVSDDGRRWQVPPGLVNPLALPGPMGYLADASIFYDSNSDQLWVYYLDTQPINGSLRIVRLISSDGVRWQDQGTLFKVLTYNAESPTVEKAAGGYYMWTVNSGAVGCSATSTVIEYRFSTDGMNWSAPQPANLEQSGYVVWHLNVSYISSKQEYWAAVAAYANGADCGHTVLFYSKSRDGVNWTSYNKIVLAPGTAWDNAEIYRASLLYDLSNNHLRVWYSARNSLGAWHVGLTEGDYDQFLEWLQP